MENVLTRNEHEEFAKRIDAENERQNNRIKLLEDNVKKITDLTVSVEKIAINMAIMVEELKKQGERLEKLETEPAEESKQIKKTFITTIISTIIGLVVGSVWSLIMK